MDQRPRNRWIEHRRRDDCPDGPRRLRPRQATREPNGTLWFRAELDGTGDQVWFRIDRQSIGRMPDKTPEARSRRLVDALLAQVAKSDLPLRSALNRFDARVSAAGDTWVERLRW